MNDAVFIQKFVSDFAKFLTWNWIFKAIQDMNESNGLLILTSEKEANEFIKRFNFLSAIYKGEARVELFLIKKMGDSYLYYIMSNSFEKWFNEYGGD